MELADYLGGPPVNDSFCKGIVQNRIHTGSMEL